MTASVSRVGPTAYVRAALIVEALLYALPVREDRPRRGPGSPRTSSKYPAWPSGRLPVVAGPVLVLLGLTFCIAVGLDPAVVALYRRGLPRWAALTVVLVIALGMFIAREKACYRAISWVCVFRGHIRGRILRDCGAGFAGVEQDRPYEFERTRLIRTSGGDARLASGPRSGNPAAMCVRRERRWSNARLSPRRSRSGCRRFHEHNGSSARRRALYDSHRPERLASGPGSALSLRRTNDHDCSRTPLKGVAVSRLARGGSGALARRGPVRLHRASRSPLSARSARR